MRIVLFIFFLIGSGTAFSHLDFSNSTTTDTTEEAMKGNVLRHVVLFKFKDDAMDKDVKEVEDAFYGLSKKIKEIKDFEWGKNNSPEGLDQGFTHCFVVTFKTEEDREVYLPHPEHKKFVEILKPHLDKVLVVDYWTR